MTRHDENTRKTISSCAQCRHFCDDPAELEKMFQGILILSSTYGSTRARAGVCAIDQTFHDPEPACDNFAPRLISSPS